MKKSFIVTVGVLVLCGLLVLSFVWGYQTKEHRVKEALRKYVEWSQLSALFSDHYILQVTDIKVGVAAIFTPQEGGQLRRDENFRKQFERNLFYRYGDFCQVKQGFDIPSDTVIYLDTVKYIKDSFSEFGCDLIIIGKVFENEKNFYLSFHVISNPEEVAEPVVWQLPILFQNFRI